MYKFCKILIFLMLVVFVLGFNQALAFEEHTSTLLKGGVVALPEAIYGSWRVVSKCVDTDAPAVFKSNGIDLWNLLLENNVIKLCNPFSGASAEVKVESVSDNKVVFTKVSKYGNKILTDTVSITITTDHFEGYDALRLDTISDVNGRIIKTETAKYSISGEKIFGDSVLE